MTTVKTDHQKLTLAERAEAYISRLSSRNNFWHRICSLIWLPYAFRSGISMKSFGTDRFVAILPFRKFNRNWYNAMAGAALLANSEVAGGMYLFAHCGGDYIVVCKRLTYNFLRPCVGPAIYNVKCTQNLEERVAAGGEFNIDLELEIVQQVQVLGAPREKRVGRCDATFHCAPKAMLKARRVARG
ncbi:MAG: hypothetical protein EXS15_05740 [Phycisphaerales bacterium]|nr:hypothetical protein [Phycisphaerales bacterium]